MSRARTGLAVAAALTALCAAPSLPADAAAQIGRPNVVVVMTDDQDTATVRPMSSVRRELVRDGTRFRNAFATFPLCCPSRATFLTGQYAHNHGVLTNVDAVDGFDATESLAVSMRHAGYRTGFVGKYLGGYQGRRVADIPPGWHEWYVPVGPGGDVKMFDYQLHENDRVRSYGRRARDYQTDVFARKARGFISRSALRPAPFFLTLATTAPHVESGDRTRNPRPAPRHRTRFRSARAPRRPSYNEADVSDKPSFVRRPRLKRRERGALDRLHRDRLASLLAVDDAVGSIVRRLRELGELRQTLIVFTSDNGFLLGEHRRSRKVWLYEESARVPLILRGPGVPAGAQREQLVGNVDLAPTILDVAGVTPGEAMDGRSLIPLAQRPDEAADRDLLLENADSSAVRTQGFMYAEHTTGEIELYDLRSDPFQLQNVAAHQGYAAERAKLAARLAELRFCAGASCP